MYTLMAAADDGLICDCDVMVCDARSEERLNDHDGSPRGLPNVYVLLITLKMQ